MLLLLLQFLQFSILLGFLITEFVSTMGASVSVGADATSGVGLGVSLGPTAAASGTPLVAASLGILVLNEAGALTGASVSTVAPPLVTTNVPSLSSRVPTLLPSATPTSAIKRGNYCNPLGHHPHECPNCACIERDDSNPYDGVCYTIDNCSFIQFCATDRDCPSSHACGFAACGISGRVCVALC